MRYASTYTINRGMYESDAILIILLYYFLYEFFSSDVAQISMEIDRGKGFVQRLFFVGDAGEGLLQIFNVFPSR